MKPSLTSHSAKAVDLRLTSKEELGFKTILTYKKTDTKSAKFLDKNLKDDISAKQLFVVAQNFCVDLFMKKKDVAQIITQQAKKENKNKDAWAKTYKNTKDSFTSGCAKGVLTPFKGLMSALDNVPIESVAHITKILK